MLITPAAYHRIAVHGEDSEDFRNFAGRVMLLAMFFLGLGLASEFFVVCYKITNSMVFALGCSGALLFFFYGLWLGYSRWKKSDKDAKLRSNLFRTHLINAPGVATRAKAHFIEAWNAGLKARSPPTGLKRIYEMASIINFSLIDQQRAAFTRLVAKIACLRLKYFLMLLLLFWE